MSDVDSTAKTEVEEILSILRKLEDGSYVLTREERSKILFRQHPPDEEDAFVQNQTGCSSYSALIEKCLIEGAWKLTDDELEIAARGVPLRPLAVVDAFEDSRHGQSPETKALIDKAFEDSRVNTRDEARAMYLGHKERNYRREEKRAEKQLHRYRLLQQRTQQALQENATKEKPESGFRLERRLFEQVIRETGGASYVHPPPADSIDKTVSQKIQDFAIKAQLKTRLDIGTWGFAILRLDYADEAAWTAFKARLESLAQKILKHYGVPEQMCEMLRFIYIEDQDTLSGVVDQTKLAKHWISKRYDENVLIQTNHRFFISVDEKAMQAANACDPPIYLHDADVEEAPSEASSFPGYIETSVLRLMMNDIAGVESSMHYVRTMWELTH